MTDRLYKLHPDILNFLTAMNQTIESMRHRGGFISREKFVLENGFAQDRALRDEGSGVVRECYKNALELAREEPDRYVYTEGFALGAVIVVQHAWVTDLHDGSAVDPTWTLERFPDQSEYLAMGRVYLGIPFKPEWHRERMIEQRFYPSVLGCYEAAVATGIKCPLLTGTALQKDYLHEQAARLILARNHPLV